MKLIFGKPNDIIPLLAYEPAYVYNVGSFYQRPEIKRLDKLTPSTIEFGKMNVPLDDRGFDIWYANYLLNNNDAFIDMMQIVYALYGGYNVFCLVDIDEYKELFIESILKFIQQRYGFNGYIINSQEDITSVEESDFSLQGVYNLDIDKERFAEWETKQNANYGNK